MARKAASKFQAGGSGTDIMTSLIGCLILILLGILIMVFITETVMVIAEPDNKSVQSVVKSHVEGFPESKAFPHGNRFKEADARRGGSCRPVFVIAGAKVRDP